MADTEVQQIDHPRPLALVGLAAMLPVAGLPFWCLGARATPSDPHPAIRVAGHLSPDLRGPERPRRASRAGAADAAPPVFAGSDGQRITPARIRRYLERRGSPLARYAETIVRAGVRHRIDPRTVVAIAGVESSFGVYVSGYNAWGWGGYRWSSWEHAIMSYSRQVAAAYPSLRRGGFVSAAPRYAPVAWRHWAAKAAGYFGQI